MQYRYLSSDEYMVLYNSYPFRCKGVYTFPDSKFLEWLEECGVKYYLYCVNGSPRKKFYAYCDKKFGLARMKYDF